MSGKTSKGDDLLIHTSEEFLQKANLNPKLYEEYVQWAKNDWEGFWDYFGKNEITWFEHYKKVFDDSNAPFYKFFVGGKLNVSYNCIDRHLSTWRKNRAAIIWESEIGESKTITYRELYYQVNKFANVLKTLGVKKGDRVILYMPMIVELPIAMLACARIGAIHSVVFGGFSPAALKERILDANANVIVTADGGRRGGRAIPLKDSVDEAIRDLKTIKYVVVVKHIGRDVFMKTLRDFWWNDLMNDPDYAKNYCEPEVMDSEDPFFLLYTSGSTGKPKGVLHTTAGYLIWRILTAKWVFDLKDEDTFWSTADLGWISGHSYTLYGPLSIGSTTLIYEGIPIYPDPGQWWRLIEKYSVNVLYTAPTAIRALMKYGEEHPKKYNLSSLRLLTTGGERLNSAAWLWYYKNVGQERCPIIDAYGQTETAGHMLSSLPIAPQKPGSVGIPVPGAFPEIVDDQGNVITEAYKTGNLVFTKPWPSMVRTLWQNDELYKKTYWSAFDGKYYLTGDIAYKDEDGYYWMEGRIDDVVNVSAHRIGCAEIENALTSYPAIAEAAVVGVPDDVTGEAIFAYVVLKEGVDLTHHDELVRDIRDHAGRQIGPIAKPSEIVFVDQMPKTRSGKIVRRLLKALATDKPITQDISTLEDTAVIEKLKKALKERND